MLRGGSNKMCEDVRWARNNVQSLDSTLFALFLDRKGLLFRCKFGEAPLARLVAEVPQGLRWDL